MTDFAITLTQRNTGAVFVFQDEEVPQHVLLGGVQRLAVHELIGGGRAVDSLGAQPRDISWEGWAAGTKAETDMQALDTFRKDGQPCFLAIGDYRYMVLIQEFKPTLVRLYRWSYSITFVVVADFNGPAYQAALPQNSPGYVDRIVAMDFYTCIKIVTDGIWPLPMTVQAQGLKAQLSALAQIQKGISSLASATSAQIAAITGPLKTLRQQVSQMLAQVGNLTSNVTTVGGLLPGNPVARNAGNLTTQAAAFAAHYQLEAVDGSLARVQTNVSNAPQSTTVTVIGGNLQDIAVQQYGNAELWTAIAKANGLTDPVIVGQKTLVIPKNPQNTGGLLNA